jgi:lipoprotein-anchoring transpeptidase ErfK/SrfK
VGGNRRVAVRRSPPRRSLLVAALALLAVALVASGTAVGNTLDGPGVVAAPATVALRPADGGTAVDPAAPVGVSVSGGMIETVELIDGRNVPVPGALSEDRRIWRPDVPLAYGTTYRWSGWATGGDGERLPIAASFTTVTPKKLVKARLNVADGETYGVAMPIAVMFSAPVSDRAAVERALSVRTSQPVEGAWAWMSDTSVHWRPREYFPAHTLVTVSGRLFGLHLGGGSYGREDVSSTFSIGREFVLRGDTREHRLRAFADGVQVGDYKASYGLDSDPRRATRSGVHVATSKHASYLMNSETFGYTDFPVKWAVRISNNGEFTHAAPWSTGAQGRRNVSHGCVNLSMADARAVFNAVLTGDPVEITGSGQQLAARDGDYHDWAIPWEEWRTRSALARSS